MIEGTLALVMFIVLLMVILTGFPVVFALSGTALLFAVIGHFSGIFFLSDLGFIPARVWQIMSNFTLVAVPLFVFMGIMLEKSGVAEELLNCMSRLLRRQKGGLANAVVIVGAFLAASTGIVGATVVTMGVLALPTMLNKGFDQKLSCGTIAAAGTLGQIIPPSIVLVLLGDIMNVDVGDLFVGAIFPGLLLVGLYLLYIKIITFVRPQCAPTTIDNENSVTWREFAGSFLPPVGLMIVVLGSILGGVASPTEAAACGAAGATLVTFSKGQLNRKILAEVSQQTAVVSAMVFFILIGAQFFGVVFRGLQGDDAIITIVNSLAMDRASMLFVLMILIFLLGFFLDFLEITFIVIPIILPIMLKFGYDPLWLGILIAVNLQTSFLTPPFGFALFYLKGVAPKNIKTMTIYQGAIPFVGIQVLAITLIALFPALVLWLPGKIFP